MAKGSGSTKSFKAASSNESILGGGSGIASGNTFSPSTKISDFEGSSTLGGGEFSITTKDGKYTMVIETTNFVEDGEGWTLVSLGVREGTGRINNLINDSVQTGPAYSESMGATFNHEQAAVAKFINNIMPYYAERANKWIKNKI